MLAEVWIEVHNAVRGALDRIGRGRGRDLAIVERACGALRSLIVSLYPRHRKPPFVEGRARATTRAGERLRAGNKHRLASRGLVAATTFTRRDTDQFSRDGSGRGFEFGSDDSLDIVNDHEDVLRFEIGMNDPALPVHVVQAE